MAELRQLRSGFVGLMTATSPEVTPPGGLLEADNVVIRNDNVIEPRPGFQTSALPAATASAGALGRIEYPLGSNQAGIIHDGTISLWDGFSGQSSAITDEDSVTLAWESYAGAVARRNLYLLTSDALRVARTPGATVAYRAGAPVPAIGRYQGLGSTSVSGGAGAVPDGNYRAYRAVTRRTYTDATGAAVIVRSAPSNRFQLFEPTGPANQRVRVFLHTGDDFVAGDVIELYATECTETIPTEEFYLNQEYALTSADVSAGYVALLDDVTDDDLGAALYTNESREGAESSNERPPQAGCAGVYHDSLWLGDLTYPAGLLLAVRMDGGVDPTDSLGQYTADGVLTNTSAVVSSVNPTHIARLKVGMLVYRQSTDQHAGTGWLRITAVGATTYTLNQVWNGSTGAKTVLAVDSIRLGSEYWPVVNLVESIRGGSTLDGDNQTFAGSDLYTARVLEQTELSGYRVQYSLLVAALLPSTTAPQVWATNGSLYSPVLPEPTVATGYQMPQDVLPDHVAWSKQGEPEHFPLTNIERAGDGGAQVLCLGASRNSIMIATDRGMYRASGYADSSISFDEVNKDVRALGRRCMDGVGEFQYVACDDGVWECDENSCTNITKDVITDLDALCFAVADTRVSSLKVVANGKDDEVLVCCPASTSIAGAITSLFVFNTKTRAWTRWLPSGALAPAGLTDVTVKGPRRRITGCISGAESNWLEKIPTSSGLYADSLADSSVTITAVDSAGTGITIAAPTAGFAIGDAFVQSSVTYLITAITSSTVYTVHKAGLTTGAATPWGGIPCVITPSVNAAKAPHVMKVWAEGAIQWARRTGVYMYWLEFRSAITGSNTGTLQTRILAADLNTNSDARSAPGVSRFLTPKAAARGTHLCFTLTIRQALANWAVEALSVRVRTTADKAPRRLP